MEFKICGLNSGKVWSGLVHILVFLFGQRDKFCTVNVSNSDVKSILDKIYESFIHKLSQLPSQPAIKKFGLPNLLESQLL